MKKLMILCAMFLLASCSKTAIEEVTIGATDYEFTAYAPDGQTDARTYVDEQMKLHWTKNDLITIFHGMLEPLKFGFRGETGATSGTYYNVDGIFYAPDQSAPNNVAVYPYSADHLLDENTRAVTLTMPAEQTYVENSFGLGANTMIAVTSEVNDLALYFKNVGTYLNVRLWGENQTVKTITVTATGGEALSGKAVVTPTYGGDPTCVMANTGTAPSVQLVCEEAVTVNTTEDAPVSFWIVLPPVTMASGFNVMVENADGEKQVFTIDKSVTFKRNKYNTLTRELAVVAEEKIPNNEIHYTATEQVTPYITDVFGATYLASQSTYNGTTQQGMLKFDGDVTTIGEYAFYYCDALTSVTIPDSVTEIGFGAFSHCSSLTSITIPESVTTIGDDAFYKCSSLTSITIPDSVVTIRESTFYGCSSLTSVTIPDSVAAIGESAFSGCSSLTSVTIPDSVTAIGKYAFMDCDALTSVTIGNSVTTINECAFAGCEALKEFKGKFASSDGRYLIIDGTLKSFAPAGLTSYTIPNSVTTIGDYAFSGCSSLTSITIPESVTTIGDDAFYKCSSLTSVTIPDSVAAIGESAFSGCSSLTSITIPESVTTIWEYAFYKCSSLTSVTIGGGVTTIWSYAFSGCSSLTSVTIGDSVTSIGAFAFNGCTSLTSVTIPDSMWEIEDYAFRDCSSLTSVTILDGVERIGRYAFNGCTSLTSVTIPDSVTEIGGNAFRDCSSLTSVKLGKNVTGIGYAAFENCSSLTSVTIGDSVTSIGAFAFYGCTSLTSVTIPDSVTEIGDNAFKKCPSLSSIYCRPTTPPTQWHSFDYLGKINFTIYVPKASVDAYKKEWNGYESYNIVGYDF